MELKDKNLYFVGGVVRDEIIGAESFDVDYCCEGNAIEYAKKAGLNIIKINPDFGTVRVTPHPQPSPLRGLSHKGRGENIEIDIASTREEDYPHAGHLPVVKNIGCSLRDDLKRRDFTINAMAKNTLTGEVIDYFGGMEDIKNKKLRVLHKNSFIDDPTRIVRGLKFSVRFGFELDEKTKRLQDEYLNNINYDMSYHRLKKELKETFNLNREDAYKRFTEQKIYKLLGENQILPCLKGSISELVNEFKPENIWLIYLGLFDLSNLDLTGEEKEIINSVPKIVPQTDFETYMMFKDLPLETILLYALSVDYDTAVDYLRNIRNIKIDITGEDLKAIGIEQGKIYKEIFDYVLKEKLNNPKLNKKDELEFVRRKFC